MLVSLTSFFLQQYTTYKVTRIFLHMALILLLPCQKLVCTSIYYQVNSKKGSRSKHPPVLLTLAVPAPYNDVSVLFTYYWYAHTSGPSLRQFSPQLVPRSLLNCQLNQRNSFIYASINALFYCTLLFKLYGPFYNLQQV